MKKFLFMILLLASSQVFSDACDEIETALIGKKNVELINMDNQDNIVAKLVISQESETFFGGRKYEVETILSNKSSGDFLSIGLHTSTKIIAISFHEQAVVGGCRINLIGDYESQFWNPSNVMNSFYVYSKSSRGVVTARDLNEKVWIKLWPLK